MRSWKNSAINSHMRLSKSGSFPAIALIYLHKSPSAIASIFGTMKTGACYVPVDPNAPGLRLAEIARQCGFRALITSFSLYDKLRAAIADECPMAAIFFIDKFPDAALPAPAFTF